MTANNHPFGEPIFSYSRAQAISDGVLVDLTQFPIITQHWKIHTACTDTVWNLIQAAIKEHGKDLTGILHDLSHMAKLKIGGPDGDTLYFQCIVGTKSHAFKLHCGPGDTPVPCLTFMMHNES